MIAHQVARRKAAPTAALLHNWLSPLPPQLRRTLSQDNGTEFADHHTLRITLGINIFFCNPHSPCQKGGIENANGRAHRFLPRKADLRGYTPTQIDAIARRCNATPRKCLGFQTPAELFSRHLLHFGCESICTERTAFVLKSDLDSLSALPCPSRRRSTQPL